VRGRWISLLAGSGRVGFGVMLGAWNKLPLLQVVILIAPRTVRGKGSACSVAWSSASRTSPIHIILAPTQLIEGFEAEAKLAFIGLGLIRRTHRGSSRTPHCRIRSSTGIGVRSRFHARSAHGWPTIRMTCTGTIHLASRILPCNMQADNVRLD